MRGFLKKVLITVIAMCLCLTVPAFASITVSSQDVVTTSKSVTWTNDDTDAEMRWLSGTHDASDYEEAVVAGTGSATVEVTENGNYTFFSKSGDTVVCDVVPITTIDHESPDITLTDLVVNDDGTMDVYYEASDYFSSCETRYKSGNCSSSEWGSATAMSGGVISHLPNGIYTLFAKDSAGNIGTYILSSDSGQESDSNKTEETSSWSREWEDIYYGASAEITPGNVKGGIAIIVAKCDSETGDQVVGAKLQLKNLDTGEVVEEWTTSECDRVFYDIDPDSKYVVTELYAPSGYSKAEAIEFYPKNLDNATLVMYDQPVKRIASSSSHSSTSIPNTLAPTPAPNTVTAATKTLTPVPKPDPGTIPTSSEKITKLPQTGGFDGMFWILFTGIALILAGSFGYVAANRKIKKIK